MKRENKRPLSLITSGGKDMIGENKTALLPLLITSGGRYMTWQNKTALQPLFIARQRYDLEEGPSATAHNKAKI